ncbi:hypothetical protein D3C76_931430 [compost metagenome]
MVEGFSADAELSCELRLWLAGGDPPLQLSGLLGGQRFLAATVGSPLLSQRNALALPLADQGALELGEGPHH